MPIARVNGDGQGGGGGGNGPGDWFQSLPFVTRYWFGAAVLTTLAVNFEIVNGRHIPFAWRFVKNDFELWRCVTCFLYVGPFEFNTLISMYLLVQFSERYEKSGPFNTGGGSGTADYVFMMMLCMALTLLTYPLVTMYFYLPPIFTRNMVYCVLYVWSKRFPEAQANIWGIPVPANYLPFAYLALSVLMGNPYMDQLHGIAIGHVYYFMAEVVPQVQGKDLLVTPAFLIDRFGIGEYRPEVVRPAPIPGAGTGAAARRAQAAAGGAAGAGGGHNWGGGGRALGRD